MNTEKLLKKLKEKNMKQESVQIYIDGIENYGYNKPIISPNKITWEITRKCNLFCKHCSKSGETDIVENELKIDEIENIMIQLKNLNITSISFSGGEFMIRKDYHEIMKLSKKYNFGLSLITNCTLVTSKIAKDWKELGVRLVQTSLDGSCSKTHDQFRGVEGAFDKTIQGIRNLISEGIYVVVAFTVSKTNVNEIKSMIDICIENKISAFTINDLLPIGRGKEIHDSILTNEEYRQLSDYFKKKKIELKDKILLAWNGAGAFDDRLADNERVLIKSKCTAALTNFNITSTGDITPCNLMQIKCGNLRKNSIIEIWNNSDVLQNLRKRSELLGKCGDCKYDLSCSGCRARAYAYTGNYMSEDPRCLREL